MRAKDGKGRFFDDRQGYANPWQAPADAPQIIASIDTARTRADARAIVTYVAFQVLQGEVDYSEHDLRESHPALKGITSEQLAAIISEALA